MKKIISRIQVGLRIEDKENPTTRSSLLFIEKKEMHIKV